MSKNREGLVRCGGAALAAMAAAPVALMVKTVETIAKAGLVLKVEDDVDLGDLEELSSEVVVIAIYHPGTEPWKELSSAAAAAGACPPLTASPSSFACAGRSPSASSPTCAAGPSGTPSIAMSALTRCQWSCASTDTLSPIWPSFRHLFCPPRPSIVF